MQPPHTHTRIVFELNPTPGAKKWTWSHQDVDDDRQEPDEDDEEQESRVGGRVLRPDDDRMDADERLKGKAMVFFFSPAHFFECCKPAKSPFIHLNDGENNQQGGQDLQVRPLRVEVEQPEEDSAGVEAATDAVELKKTEVEFNENICLTMGLHQVVGISTGQLHFK